MHKHAFAGRNTQQMVYNSEHHSNSRHFLMAFQMVFGITDNFNTTWGQLNNFLSDIQITILIPNTYLSAIQMVLYYNSILGI